MKSSSALPLRHRQESNGGGGGGMSKPRSIGSNRPLLGSTPSSAMMTKTAPAPFCWKRKSDVALIIIGTFVLLLSVFHVVFHHGRLPQLHHITTSPLDDQQQQQPPVANSVKSAVHAKLDGFVQEKSAISKKEEEEKKQREQELETAQTKTATIPRTRRRARTRIRTTTRTSTTNNKKKHQQQQQQQQQ